MHIHILGICGTFMGSLAVLAKQLGHTVSGSDANVYPPMSTQLEEQGISLMQGFEEEHLQPHPDLVVIGNAMSRGNTAVEYVLNNGLEYCSGPEWLARWALRDKWVLGVAGTHGKTTTSSMLTWILQYAGMKPGYLIGGVAKNFTRSADMGDSAFFVVEADEYDSAFFDKRSKFIHYGARTVILNNLEFDHADIFDDLAAIQKQFNHLVRTVPGNGLIISPVDEENIEQVLAMGCWTDRQRIAVDLSESQCQQLVSSGGVLWNAQLQDKQGEVFEVSKYSHKESGSSSTSHQVNWDQTGLHNVSNALAAIVAAHHVGVEVATACSALNEFAGVKRRMELRGEINGVKVYDDFAHHPTAIATTLAGLAAKLDKQTKDSRLIAVIEPRSNTMKSGIHQQALESACAAADMTLWFNSEANTLDLDRIISQSKVPGQSFTEVEAIVDYLVQHTAAGDHVVIMSNGGFGGIHQKLLDALES